MQLIELLVMFTLWNVLVQSIPIKRNRRITMGTMAKVGQFPYAAHIYWFFFDSNITSRYRCSGALIHKLFVITSANCFQELIDFHKKRDNKKFELDLGDYPTEIRAGFVDRSSSIDYAPKSQLRSGERLFVHNDYLHRTSLFDVDVALIRVNFDWDFNQIENNVKKLPIGRPPNSQDAWIECLAAGFGNFNTTRMLKNDSVKATNNDGLPRRNNRLRFYELRVGKVKYCKYLQLKLDQMVFHVDEFYLCGDSNNSVVRRQTCFGDSGGPLICNGLLLGVFSQRRERGNKPCDVQGFSLFTAVGAPVVHDWMKLVIPDMLTPAEFPEYNPWDVTTRTNP